MANALSERQRDGELAGEIPSVRTISNIRREMPHDGDKWRLQDADPATVDVVLRTLHEVCIRSEGRVTSLTRAEAHLIPIIDKALAPRWAKLPGAGRAWQAYVWTRFYLTWVKFDQDEEDVALLFASMHTGGGRTPINAAFQIRRAYNAAIGWLPPELVEINGMEKGAKS